MFSRRKFIWNVGLGASSVLVTGALSRPVLAQSAGALSPDESSIVLQVARAIAVFPAPFPKIWNSGPAIERATAARLDARVKQLSPDRLALIRQGAQILIGGKLLGADRPRLVDGIGRLVEPSPKAPQPSLIALVALAGATISQHFTPGQDAPARLWLGVVRGTREIAAPRKRPAPEKPPGHGQVRN